MNVRDTGLRTGPMILAIGLIMAASGASAQTEPPPAFARHVTVGPTLTAGVGYVQTIALGAGASWDLSRHLRLRAEATRFVDGIAPCDASWPESEACSARPVEAVAGIGLVARPVARLAVTAELLGGVNRMDRSDLGGAAPAVRVGTGIETRLGSSWVGGVVAFRSTAFNAQYEDLIGTRPIYRMVGLTLRYQPTR